LSCLINKYFKEIKIKIHCKSFYENLVNIGFKKATGVYPDLSGFHFYFKKFTFNI